MRASRAACWMPLLASLPASAQSLPPGSDGAHRQFPTLRVGSKKFTESVILGELAVQLARTAGLPAEHRRELGGTRILWEALKLGEIDVYAEYTGTLTQEILVGESIETDEELRAALRKRGIRMTRPLGFNNTYAIGMREDHAARLGIHTISDLKDHSELRFGFGNEVMDRADGWRSLRDHYNLPQRNVCGMDHDVAYRALVAGSIDAMDLYSTDAEIQYYGLRVLRDDLQHFHKYDALYVYRADLSDRTPAFLTQLRRIEGAIQETQMIGLNARAKLDGVSEQRVAHDFLVQHLGVGTAFHEASLAERLGRRTREHLFLVLTSLTAAVLVSVPIGIACARRPRMGQPVLALVGIIQTIPSLALLVLLIKPMGSIGWQPAVVALFLYSLLPIVRNTCAGLQNIPLQLRESAEALGLPAWSRLRWIEVPLASPTILAGIKTAAVINIGFATLGALIGAGGYGQPILTGIRLDSYALILEGALPAAGLAVITQGLFEILEHWIVPRGLRIDKRGR